MTDKKLMELLVVIDDHYGRIRSKEERMADTKIYIQAFGAIPDEIVEKALYTAFTQCRYQNQLIVDWCAEVKKLLAAGLPSANDLWAQAATAAKQITANLYYMTHGGLVTSEGKLTGENFKTRNAEIFAALPMVVQRWAGSPADLSEIFSSRSSADLRQFVRPASTGLCRMPRLRVCSPRLCPAAQLRHRLEVARHEVEKTIPQPVRVRFVCDGWLHPRKHGLLPAGGRVGNRAGYLRQPFSELADAGD